MDFNPASSITRVMVNFRVSGKEKAELDELVKRMASNRGERYRTRGSYIVGTSDVIRWGLEALRRELDSAQAAAEAAEYNAKHPARKPAKATSPATKPKRAKSS